ncbi:hypothetical protein [Candidatus Nitrospira bockiana]
MTRRFIVALVTAIVSGGGCAEWRQHHDPPRVHEVEIREGVQPLLLYAGVGDEVRWHNRTDDPVRLSFLGTTNLETVRCQKGFSWFGVMRDYAKIKPGHFVSLCFAKPGTIRFNVWMDANNLRQGISPTATIRVTDESG